MFQYLSSFRNISPLGLKYNHNINNNNPAPVYRAGNLAPLKQDTVSFTGMSAPSHYKSVFDYLAADILSKNKKFQVDGSMLSASNITKAIDKLCDLYRVYGPDTTCSDEKIKWKP